MRLTDYSNEISACRDDIALRDEYGIDDNYPIILGGNLEEIEQIFSPSGRIILAEGTYQPGTISFSLYKKLNNGLISGVNGKNVEVMKKHQQYQMRNFFSALVLKINKDGKKISGISDLFALRLALEDILNRVGKNTSQVIPVCLPRSPGISGEPSRIVYYPDSLEAEAMERCNPQIVNLVEHFSEGKEAANI